MFPTDLRIPVLSKLIMLKSSVFSHSSDINIVDRLGRWYISFKQLMLMNYLLICLLIPRKMSVIDRRCHFHLNIKRINSSFTDTKMNVKHWIRLDFVTFSTSSTLFTAINLFIGLFCRPSATPNKSKHVNAKHIAFQLYCLNGEN